MNIVTKIIHRLLSLAMVLVFLATLSFEFLIKGSSVNPWKTLAIAGFTIAVAETLFAIMIVIIDDADTMEVLLLQVGCIVFGCLHAGDAMDRAAWTEMKVVASSTITINIVYAVFIVFSFIRAFKA